MQRYRSRNQIVVAVVVVAVAITLILFTLRKRAVETGDESAARTVGIRQRIEILFDAAQKSDMDRYLDCFAEPLRSRMKQQLADAPTALRRGEAELTSFVCPPDVDAGTGDEAVVVVEKIYLETSERVRFRMRRIDGEWKISEMQPLDRTAPETKYGTPVVPLKRVRR